MGNCRSLRSRLIGDLLDKMPNRFPIDRPKYKPFGGCAMIRRSIILYIDQYIPRLCTVWIAIAGCQGSASERAIADRIQSGFQFKVNVRSKSQNYGNFNHTLSRIWVIRHDDLNHHIWAIEFTVFADLNHSRFVQQRALYKYKQAT